MPNEENHPMSSAQVHALAHPIRMQLLDALSDGELHRTSDLAAAVGSPVNKVSFHLTRLSDAGIITKQQSAIDKRTSWWQLVAQRTLISLTPQATEQERADFQEIAAQAEMAALREVSLWYKTAAMSGEFADGMAPHGGNFRVSLGLDENTIKEFRKDFEELCAKYSWRDESQDRYTMFGYLYDASITDKGHGGGAG